MHLWIIFVLSLSLCIENVMGQTSSVFSSQDELPPDYCRLPEPPKFGSFFFVHCYGEDSEGSECLNIPSTPVRPNLTLTYICDDGFYLPRGHGYEDIRCLGGKWIPPPPICTDKICSPPKDPPTGHYSTHPLDCAAECGPPESKLRDNTLLRLECDKGYQTAADSNALCVGGTWIRPPTCLRSTNETEDPVAFPSEASRSSSCHLPAPPEHGTYLSTACYGVNPQSPECYGVPGSPAQHLWTLTFFCDEGYLPTNNQTKQQNDQFFHSKCVKDQWLPPPPTCSVSLISGCTMPSDPANGQYALSCEGTQCSAAPGSLVPQTQKLTLSCNESYTPAEGYALSTCVEGRWSPVPPTCSDSSETVEIDQRELSDIQSQFKTCVLPKPPKHGSYFFFGSNCHGAEQLQPRCQGRPGQTVPHLQVVNISCEQGYQLGGQSSSKFVLVSCGDGQWSQPFPECFKECPLLKSYTVDFECYQGPKPVPCDSPMLPNTTVKTQCKLNHATTDEPRDLICKANGQWSGGLPNCKPNCGLSKLHNYNLQPTIASGQASPLGYFPWHAGLYYRDKGTWEAKCGGTLISPHIVLTAAHCVTKESVKLNPEDIRVALGKYYRDWYANEANAVTRDVLEIRIQQNYLGVVQNLNLDIALMALESRVVVNSFVMPACVDYHHTHHVQSQMTGYVAGWGQTSDCSRGQVCGNSSTTLQYTTTSFLDFLQCHNAMQKIKRLPFSRITTDKFCAGNGSYSVTQKGDSGGGFTFEFDGVHYVKGVTSAKISLEDKYSFAAFTNVTYHIAWVVSIASYFDSLVT